MASCYGPRGKSGYVKLSVFQEKQVRCKITLGRTYLLNECVNCGDLTQTSYLLKCPDYLCDECFVTCMPYTCTRHKRETSKEQALRLSYIYKDNINTLQIECPKCPGISRKCLETAEHIRQMHPELFEDKPDGRSDRILESTTVNWNVNFSSTASSIHQIATVSTVYQDQESLWKGKQEHPKGNDRQGGSDLLPDFAKSADLVSQDLCQEPTAVNSVAPACPASANQDHGITVCRYCNSPDYKEDIKKHELICPYRPSGLNTFGGKMLSGSPSFGDIGDTGTKPKEAAGPKTLAPELRGEGSYEWNKKTFYEVRDLQERANELEKKLRRIEEPLKMIIGRLERGF